MCYTDGAAATDAWGYERDGGHGPDDAADGRCGGEWECRGDVCECEGEGGQPGLPGSPVTHALAQEAVLHRTAQTMELKGTDAAPARMWQGPSQVEAANLLLDRGRIRCRRGRRRPTGVVRSVFASAGIRVRGPGVGAGARDRRPEGGRAPETGERVVRVTSARLDYSGAVA